MHGLWSVSYYAPFCFYHNVSFVKERK